MAFPLLAAGQLALGAYSAIRGSRKQRNFSDDVEAKPDWWVGPEHRSEMIRYATEMYNTLKSRQAEISGLYDPGQQYWESQRIGSLQPYGRQMMQNRLDMLSLMHKSYGANLGNSPSAMRKFSSLSESMAEKYGEYAGRVSMDIAEKQRLAKIQGFGAAQSLGRDTYNLAGEMVRLGQNLAAGYSNQQAAQIGQANPLGQAAGGMLGANPDVFFGAAGAAADYFTNPLSNFNLPDPNARIGGGVDPSLLTRGSFLTTPNSYSVPTTTNMLSWNRTPLNAGASYSNPLTASGYNFSMNNPSTITPQQSAMLMLADGGYVPAGVKAIAGEAGRETIITEDGRMYEVDKATNITGGAKYVLPFSLRKYMSNKYTPDAQSSKGLGQGHHGGSGVQRSLMKRGI